MTTDPATTMTKPRRRWQFTLRTTLVGMAVIAFAVWYAAHFWKMTIQARRHRATIEQSPWVGIIPPEYIDNERRIQAYHQAKAEEYFAARWYPWRSVEASTFPVLIETVPK